MRIAIICTLYPPYILGGAEISVSLLAKGFAEAGNEVVVITTGERDSKEVINGVNVFRVKNKNIYWRYPQREKSIVRKSLWHLIDIYNPFYIGKVESILRNFKPDVINTSNLCGLSTVVWDVAHKLNIPIVHTLRDYYLLCPQQTMIKGTQSCEKQCFVCHSYSVVKKKMSKKVDALVGISDFIREKHISFGYFKNAKIAMTVPNSVDSIPIEEKDVTHCIGYIGRLSPEKGIEFMIEAFMESKLSKQYKLLIAGTGNKGYADSLKTKYATSQVVFVGKQKQTDFFKQIDLLVVPSLWDEPFGRVVIEAYASHCPVFMSDNGGLKELQVDGISWCFNTKNSKELVSLLDSYMNNRLTIKLPLFDKEVEKYSEAKITESYMGIFQKILSRYE